MARSLVFVCTSNTGRSPMAEAYAKKMAGEKGEDWEIHSAGLAAFPGVPVDAEAVETLKKDGIDIQGQGTRPLSKPLVESAALILTLSEQHRDMIRKKMPPLAERVLTLRELAGADHLTIRDPQGEGQQAYDEVGAEIKKTLEQAWPKLKERMA